jgi:hypothetical protein
MRYVPTLLLIGLLCAWGWKWGRSLTIAGELKPLIQGNPIRGTTKPEPHSGRHTLLFLNAKGNIHPWQDEFDGNWKPSRLRKVEFVAYVGKRRPQTYYAPVVVREAATGRIRFRGFIQDPRNRPDHGAGPLDVHTKKKRDSRDELLGREAVENFINLITSGGLQRLEPAYPDESNGLGITALTCSTDGKFVLGVQSHTPWNWRLPPTRGTVALGGEIVVWNAEALSIDRVLQVPRRIFALHTVATNASLIRLDDAKGISDLRRISTAKVVNTFTNEIPRPDRFVMAHEFHRSRTRQHPDGKTQVTASSGWIQRTEQDSGKVRAKASIKVHAYANSSRADVQVSMDGRFAAVGDGILIEVFDLQSGKIVAWSPWLFEFGDIIRTFTFAPDGESIIFAVSIHGDSNRMFRDIGGTEEGEFVYHWRFGKG